MGPIGIKAHLAPFMPTHPDVPTGALPGFKSDAQSFGCMAAAPYGSALILPISYAYISMMGSEALTNVRPPPPAPARPCPARASAAASARAWALLRT